MRFLAIAGVCVVVLIAAVMLLARTDWEILHQGMSETDTGLVAQQLTDFGERYRFGPEPGMIEVPMGNASRVKYRLAFEGSIPQSGYVYSIYELGRGFGATETDRRQYGIYQMQERIRETIIQSPMIRDAKVDLSIPETRRILFASDVAEPTAAVVLFMQGDARLTPAQVRGMEQMVASAVEGLTAENVTITDGDFNLLRGEDEEPTEHDIILRRYQLLTMSLNDLRSSLLRFAIPAFGADKMSVVVNGRINWRTEDIEEIEFTPVVGDEDGIIVAMQTLREQATAFNRQALIEGADPNGGAPFYPEYEPTEGSYSRFQQDINYEVNQALRRIETEWGNLVSVSVSVMLNGDDDFFTEDRRLLIENSISNFLRVYIEDSYVSVVVIPFPEIARLAEMRDYEDALRDRQNLYAFITSLVPIILIFAALLIIILQTFGLLRYKPEMPEVHDLLTPEQLELIGLAMDGTPLPESLIEEHATDEEKLRMSQIRAKLEEIIHKNPELVAELMRNWLSADDPYG